MVVSSKSFGVRRSWTERSCAISGKSERSDRSSECSFLIIYVRNECDATGQGALDRGSFVTGMWRIDEELRKAKGKPSSSVSSRKRSPPQATSHKPILR